MKWITNEWLDGWGSWWEAIRSRDVEDRIYWEPRALHLTDLEADEIIRYIKENEVHSDPKHQYEAMRKNGMFNEKAY